MNLIFEMGKRGLLKVFPQRGNPPKVPEGWENYEGKPFIISKKWRDCVMRILKEETTPCWRVKMRTYCEKDSKFINYLDCEDCK